MHREALAAPAHAGILAFPRWLHNRPLRRTIPYRDAAQEAPRYVRLALTDHATCAQERTIYVLQTA